MNRRPLIFIATIALLPTLISCAELPEEQAPLSEEAIAAVADDAGAPTLELAREVDDLFNKQGLGETRAFILLQDGKLAAERYALGYGPETRFISWSMANTVTALMVGMLIADGRLRLDESAPVELWQRPGDPRGEITLRQLLQMRSGLRHNESAGPAYETDLARLLFLDGRDDMARWAREQPLEAEPGAEFKYATSTSVILADIAANALTDSAEPNDRRMAVSDYLEARLFTPLDITSMVPEFDASGTLIGGSMIHGNAHDWAKLGEFMRLMGRGPDGSQLVPRGWIEKMLMPSPRSPQYGFQTWLNREFREVGSQEVHPLFPDRAPSSLYAMIGHMGQYVIVSPSQRITLVRLGHSNDEERIRMTQELADIVELYPER